MESVNSEQPRVVVGVIGNDIHVVANRILCQGLEHNGFWVCNLRTYNFPDDFVEAALECDAHAVLLSSINGEGEKWCPDIRGKFDEFGMQEVILYAGGNLVVGSRPQEEVVNLFLGFGFDRVYYQYCDFDEMISQLKVDVEYVQRKRADSRRAV